MRTNALLLAVLLPAAVAACAGEPQYVRVATHPVLVDEADAGALRAAILQGLQRRRFRTDGEEPGRIFATYVHGGDEVRIALEYTSGSFAVRYLASGAGRAAPNPDGSMEVEASSAHMIAKLEHDVQDDVQHRIRFGPLAVPGVGTYSSRTTTPVSIPPAPVPPGYAPRPAYLPPPGAAPPGSAPGPTSPPPR
ncbi:MAG TPA: hypothetical protein VGM56_07280 [Byssovorax sp.]|jgi:hypothetical protein